MSGEPAIPSVAARAVVTTASRTASIQAGSARRPRSPRRRAGRALSTELAPVHRQTHQTDQAELHTHTPHATPGASLKSPEMSAELPAERSAPETRAVPLEQLFACLQAVLWHAALHRLAGAWDQVEPGDLAADLVQDVFLRAWQHRALVEQLPSFAAQRCWLVTTLSRLVCEVYRRRARPAHPVPFSSLGRLMHRATSSGSGRSRRCGQTRAGLACTEWNVWDEWNAQEDAAATGTCWPMTSAHQMMQADPHEWAVFHETADLVAACCPPQHRPLLSFLLAGWTTKAGDVLDLAERLGLQPAAVKMRISRLRHRYRTNLHLRRYLERSQRNCLDDRRDPSDPSDLGDPAVDGNVGINDGQRANKEGGWDQ